MFSLLWWYALVNYGYVGGSICWLCMERYSVKNLYSYLKTITFAMTMKNFIYFLLVLVGMVLCSWVGPAVGLAVLLRCECGPTLLKYLTVRLCSLAIVPRLDLLCCFVVRTVCGIGHAIV
ncbi:hypothetical protein DM860_011416 [Cuscuta australis]|uniref:Uncharacterized protein n=1 Tax=Cuscuta australis TaxID=267555 RepID=A0A328DUP7_9ASTE|nr:hypothetical protein DM860_011416 [Cuscuta australis]